MRFLLIVASVALGPATLPAERLFVEKVRPLLERKCLACHGNDVKKLRGKLDLRTRAGMLAGGESGYPALVAGDPGRSPLFIAVTRTDDDLVMPPKENDKLAPREIEWIRAWIAAGAPWSGSDGRWEGGAAVEGVAVPTSGGVSPSWTNRRYKPEDIWAYQPVRRVPVPTEVVDPVALRNPVDNFIQARLREKGILRLAAAADRRTLIRRATFDLLGLPPTPEEVDDFGRDTAPDAFERLVDRLLASPHHGEQAARRWLDVVRYADTGGFSNDYERPNAWRYRDYVIRSFNSDKPYDRFVLEQLAGDELTPPDPEGLIAVGFLRSGPWEHTAMTAAAVTRQHFLDDVTQNVGAALLGQGLRCASCHDHKFDPVPTRDYYRIQAVFAPVQFAERPLPFLPAENTSALVGRRREAKARLEKIVARLSAIPARQEAGARAEERRLDKEKESLERELLRYEPYAYSAYAGGPHVYSSAVASNPMPARQDGAVPAVHVLTGGSLESPAEAVTPGVLSAVHGPEAVPAATDGRRLAFARWVVDPENALTARVMVNRVWQSHFGRGLVSTPNNFGKMGARPTHPDLLDWLARWFVEHGWSLKKLHRLIMTSATYQSAAEHPEQARLEEIDPRNDLQAAFSPRRLEAEELRDSLLAVSGELNREAGGPGVLPEINWEVALQPRMVMGTVASAYLPSRTPRERNRRTIYAFRRRSVGDPLLDVFNRPDSQMSCERRTETTVTPQAFTLMNAESVLDRAVAFALSLQAEAHTTDARITLAFQRAYGRPPSAGERAAAAVHVARMTRFHRRRRIQPRLLPLEVRREMIEEQTGERISWDERLDGLEGYVRDRKAWQVGPETRALADLGLVLFNSNELITLR